MTLAAFPLSLPLSLPLLPPGEDTIAFVLVLVLFSSLSLGVQCN